ncbi:erythromycin esterase family protein [Variovorax sp. 38R]|uniref:erythromycin esterase family protein n=1 Tax=Variovorax sp. 38R TaxID=2774875 RepID=UPI0021F0835D|nr:erythromycin esterase family protein [Variovorax sp. 38R]
MNREEAFSAEQNARLVKNAEAYYRSMYLSDVSSWNLRDRHMAETLDELERHLGWRGARPRIVVWAHNSHLGDARATEMGGRRDELNVGQLMRERHGRDAVLVGFTTHAGTVTAASDWGAAAERKRVVPSRADSYEGLLHATGIDRFMLPLRGAGSHLAALQESRLERAIGVIYRPETERQSHYFSPSCPRSSTRCSTSTRHVRWRRSSAKPDGRTPRRPRPTPSACSRATPRPHCPSQVAPHR